MAWSWLAIERRFVRVREPNGIFLHGSPTRDREERVSPAIVFYGIENAVDAGDNNRRMAVFVNVVCAARRENRFAFEDKEAGP